MFGKSDLDTIVAQATPPGRGGVSIVRISGKNASKIASAILGFIPKPRQATLSEFYDDGKQVLDKGIAIYFPSPNSFTGEDVLELHGHGGPVVVDRLLQEVVKQQARIARPGEFSERAFLNNKMDLAQAEAIADLINADSEQAARSAMRSLQGEFSKRIHVLLDQLIQLRKMVEASIDFPEEDIDFLSESNVQSDLKTILQEVEKVRATAKQGALLQEGMTVVIAGEPNAGKSSLLNCLSGKESAIVTDIAGTTRDVLREYIHIDGMPLHIVDTAGLRDTTDRVEQEGLRRAKEEMKKADLVLLVVDGSVINNIDPHKEISTVFKNIDLSENVPVVIIRNKIDKINERPAVLKNKDVTVINISVKEYAGLELLKDYLKNFMGYEQSKEGVFIARRRHLQALLRAEEFLQKGLYQLQEHQAGELLAEDLRLAQVALGEITGEFTSDDLLGEIFSSFCIGK